MMALVISCELAISMAPAASNRKSGWKTSLPLDPADPTVTDARILPPTASITASQCQALNDSPKIIHASRATYIGDVCIAGITREGSSRLSIQNMNISVNACKTPIDQACTKTIKPTPAGKVVSKTIVPKIPWLPPTHRLKLGRGIPNPDSTFLSTSVTMENTSGFASAARIQSSKVG